MVVTIKLLGPRSGIYPQSPEAPPPAPQVGSDVAGWRQHGVRREDQHVQEGKHANMNLLDLHLFTQTGFNHMICVT